MSRIRVLALLLATACGRIGFDSTARGDAQDLDAELVPAVYNDLTVAANWETYDPKPMIPGAGGFYGAAFDGRYLYLVPSYNGTLDGIVVRYDTQGSFTDPAAWTSFETTSVNPGARGFNGASFDGRYLYLIPQQNAGGSDGVVARYDTQASFTTAAAWATFDTSSLSADAVGFASATFDGRYLYLVPYQGVTVVRLDTTAIFTAPSAWSTFTPAAVVNSAAAYAGAVFDGRYVYLVPFFGGSAAASQVVRYDTTLAFAAATAWTSFDTTMLGAFAKGFVGGAFDGRYLYLVPFLTGVAVPGSIAPRYDTQAGFSAASSWSLFDTRTIDAGAAGFVGGAFDGRYVYYVPYASGSGRIVRHDSTIDQALGWSSFDITTIAASANSFYGAAFDGRYLYLVPHVGSTVARFDARTPQAMPPLPAFYGSFL